MSPRTGSPKQASLFNPGSGKPVTRRRTKAVKTPVTTQPSSSPTPIAPAPGKKIWLSSTGLESQRRCPRCFWLRYNLKIYQPEGIVSRLANRYDILVKKYFDLYRGTNDLPPLVAGQIHGHLESPFQETYFVTINQKYGYMGKLDECVIRDDGKYIPVDHKTSSSDPNGRELIPAYQFQLDSYAYLLRENRKPPAESGHLVYFYPGDGDKLHEKFPMEVTVKTLATNPDRVRPTIDQAIKVLDGPLPTLAADCPFCAYVETVKKF